MTNGSEGPVFSDEEFQRRWAALRSLMAGQRSELAAIVDTDTIFYLTGFAGPASTFQALIASPDGEPIHLLRYAERAGFESGSWLSQARYYDDVDDPVFTLANMIEELAPLALRIGIEKSSPQLSVARFELLSAALFNRTFVDLSLAIGWQRLVRSDEEIAMHRRACRVIERGLAAGIEATRPGILEREIGAAVATELVRAGADTPSTGVIVSGERLSQVHGGLSDRELAAGDLVRLEMSNSVNRYWARIMRMVSLGDPSTEVRERYDLLRRLQDEQIGRMKPGAIPGELDALVRDRLPPDEWAMQLTGYALAFHEPAVIGGEIDRYRIVADETRPLEAGMVLHVYTFSGSLSLSETIAITPDGAERLTSYPREIVVLSGPHP